METFNKITGKNLKDTEAHKGDIWIKLCRKAMYHSSNLKYIAIAVIILCTSVDLISIGQLLLVAFDTPDSVVQNPWSDIIAFISPYFFTVVCTAALSVGAFLAGSYYLIWKVRKSEKMKLVLSVIFIIAVALVITIITTLRISCELMQVVNPEDLTYNPVVLASLYTSFMILGALTSIALGVAGKDAYKVKFYEDEKERIDKDKTRYKNLYNSYLQDKLSDIDYTNKKEEARHKLNDTFRKLENTVRELQINGNINDAALYKEVNDAFHKA